MTIYNEVTDCKAAPDPTEIAPISGMLAEADNCTKKAQKDVFNQTGAEEL